MHSIGANGDQIRHGMDSASEHAYTQRRDPVNIPVHVMGKAWARLMKLTGTVCLLSCLLCTPTLGDERSDRDTDGEFPTEPLTLLIGFNPGGSTDTQGQALASVLSQELAQPVQLIYYPGMGGAAAAAMLASSQDQGQVMLFGTSLPFFFTPLVTETSYDLDSFRFVGAVALDQTALVTGPDTPFDNWQDMLSYARERGELIYATQTTQDRYIMEVIATNEGINVRAVPTSGGAGMAPLVISGDADLAFSGGTHSGYTESGEIRVLASLADERLASYPEAPTIRELGYDLNMHAYRLIAVPADTPDHQVERLGAALRSAVEDPGFIAVTEDQLQMPVVSLDEESVTRTLRQQVEEYQRVMDTTGTPEEFSPPALDR